MVASSKIESLTQRFALYIEELQEFFRSRQVSCGSVSDLQGFSTPLADEGFREELASMVRSIVYRESEALPRTELMELLAVAIGGPHVEEDAPNLHEQLRPLLTFVTEVVRSQRAVVSFEPEALETTVGDDPASTHETLKLVMPQPPPVAVGAPQEPPSRQEGQRSRAPVNDRLSRALISSGATDASSAESRSARPAAQAVRPVERHSQPKKRATVAGFLRQAYWIPGACVLVLVVALTYFLQHRDRVVVHPTASRVPSVPAAAIPKPSAYGPPLAASVPGNRQSGNLTARPASTNTAPADDILAGAGSGGPAATTPGVHSTTAASPRPVSRDPFGPSRMSPRILGGREGVFLASSGSMASHLLNAPAPGYPKLASLAHVEGSVIVQVVVGRDGEVEATNVLQGPHLLRGAAEHTIRHWRYRPYLVDGKPTDVATIVTVNFRLSR